MALPNLQQLPDPTGSLSIDYVQRHLQAFKATEHAPVLGRDANVIWLKINLPPGKQDRLVVRQPLLDRLTLYDTVDHNYRVLSDISAPVRPINQLALPQRSTSQILLLRLQGSSWGKVDIGLSNAAQLSRFEQYQTLIMASGQTLLALILLGSLLILRRKRNATMLWLAASVILSSMWLAVNTGWLNSGPSWLSFALLILILATLHGLITSLSQADERSLAVLLLPLLCCLVVATTLPLLPPVARQVVIIGGLALFAVLWWLVLHPQPLAAKRLTMSACLSFIVGVVAWHLSTWVTTALSHWPLLLLTLTLIGCHALLAIYYALGQYQQQQQEYQQLGHQQVQLRDEIERLRLINQSQNHFLATISHEFRGPLNGILGSIENALLQPSHQHKEELLDARSSAEEVLDLVNQILTHTELEAGYHPLILEDISIDALLEPVLQQLRSGCDSKGLTLRVDLSHELPAQLRLDAPCIRQALKALADNALRLTSNGSLHLCVRPCALRGEAGLQITLKDNGPGLSDKELQRWQAYFQHANGTPAYQDLQAPPGVGLALVKAACYSLRGDFIVENRNPGLAVSLVFPAAAVAQQHEPLEQPTPSSQPFAQLAQDQRGRILVVEDNTINQRVIKTMLERLQFDVDLADNGEHALERLSNNNGQRYQLIFMDCEMPCMDGYTATRRIRQSHWPESICPIIAITAHALPSDRQRCLECGMNDYMSKPINMQQLRMMISRWCARLPEQRASVTTLAPDNEHSSASHHFKT
ncbi:hypothetical protein GCM10011297_04470 [Bacterioplanes sanyensis]|uniref:response regulator n=1 Tax=Bacterioplanes sanyensis TaxID=1249553 RepID=UPI00167568B9|nr:response regulator [Bacterioplanes sanyensis]GGY34536.1 hypothetical protein GCM10011297_04470 [Bacterioplanes sanyensis]